jgi:glucosylceramidase
MPNASRRDFLKLAASVGGAVIASEAKPLYAESQVAPGPVRAWRTTAQEKFQPIQSPPQWETGEELSPLAIYLEPATTYQEILGFGGAFTDASCYLLHLMEPDTRRAFLSDLYWPSRLKLSVENNYI